MICARYRRLVLASLVLGAAPLPVPVFENDDAPRPNLPVNLRDGRPSHIAEQPLATQQTSLTTLVGGGSLCDPAPSVPSLIDRPVTAPRMSERLRRRINDAGSKRPNTSQSD